MDERYYRVARIDGDYAYLERTDMHEDELLIVARALLRPLVDGWPDVAATALLMAVVVPVAVLVAVPALTRAYTALRGSRAPRSAQPGAPR